jgi:hypothetical protein|nr:hypothetical protein [Alteromonas macleodii]
MKVEYLCLVEEEIELHIAKPEEDWAERNSSQYFICFKGLSDYVDFMPSIAIVGSWEYSSFLDCISLSVDYIRKGAPNLKKIFNDDGDFPAMLSFEISKKSDWPDKLRLKFTFEQLEPVSVGARWHRKSDYIFAFYVSAEELVKVGRLLERLVEHDNVFDTLLESSSEEWLIPHELYHEDDYVKKLVMLDVVKGEVRDKAESGIKSIWIEFLENAYSYRLEIVECPCCKGKFVREKYLPWKKQCLGCYLDEKPTAIKQSDIDKIKIPSWIK